MVVIKRWVDTRNEPIRWHFRTTRIALGWRDAKIGSDIPGLCDGGWTLYVIGPDTLPDGQLVLSVYAKWKFVGQWSDNGNDYAITGIVSADDGGELNVASENDAYYRARFGGSVTNADVNMRELIHAVLDWASTSQNHGGNPYMHEHVQHAERLAKKWGIKR